MKHAKKVVVIISGSTYNKQHKIVMVDKIISRGFALPSIMIASVVMLIVLLAAISAVATSRSALDEQYYAKMAREAAESGVRMAEACIRSNSMTVTWTNAKPLKPNTNCNGDVVSGQSLYVLDQSTVRTSFSVGLVTSPSGTNTTPVDGIAERIRPSTHTVWRSAQQSLWAEVSGEVLAAQYISSGFAVVCGIFDGQTWCWGGNSDGKLGLGYASSVLELVPKKMIRDSGLLHGRVDKFVAVSNQATCVVTTDENIFCTGLNATGALGNNTTTASTRPVQVAKPSGMTGEITKIIAREAGFCAISGGDVWCWGWGAHGANGNGSTANRLTPVKVSTIGATNSPSRPVIDIASDSESRHVCAIAQTSSIGYAYCWGHDVTGALGDNTPYTDSSVPVAVVTSGVLSGKNLSKVSVSGRYPSDTSYGGTNPSDAQIVTCANAKSVQVEKRKCQRTGQSCVLDTAGKMYCWGANQYAQLGTGSGHSSYSGTSPQWRSPVPVAVTTASMNTKVITDLANAITATCGLVASENRIYCWGLNERGVLGRGSSFPTNTIYPDAASVAVQLPGLQGQTIEYITGGANRFCAITTDKRAYCWGVGGSYGQIGDGSTSDRNVPTEATMLRQFRPALIY